MNRKKKSAEILAQLGDPLPLPYRAGPVKAEPSADDSPPHLTLNEPIRRPRVFSEERLQNSQSAKETIPALPIWRREADSSLVLRPRETGTEPSVLDELQRRLETLRTELAEDDLNEALGLLEKAVALLDDVLEQKHQQSIVHELERYQQLAAESKPPSGAMKAGLIALIFLISILVSFVAGHLSSELCYHLC